MVPIPAEYMPDFWNHIPPDSLSECPLVELTCLMPNGIIVLLKVNQNPTLADIKVVSRHTLYSTLNVLTNKLSGRHALRYY